ncbi:MAG TPA: R2-like ligand-binding oxidase [Thermoanaerobaculia bacterium]|nr:R2-like ligand-binding oxidase [Thermoanaerobaculia bacterium]
MAEPILRHTSFASTRPQGLRYEQLPLRLWRKAKKLGVWNPDDLDFTRDAQDWARFSDEEKDLLLRLDSLFVAGEESVTLDLLPLIQTIAREGRVEEEMYLTSFLFEEAKHVDFFRRFLNEVARETSDLSRYHSPIYRRIFYEELPAALGALLTDPSPVAQARASVTYNMIVEGVLAETGYHAYFDMLERNDLLPGFRQGISLLKRDESRHMAYGVFLISRLVAEHEEVWPEVERRMGELLEPAIQLIYELFSAYETVPFGLKLETFVEYAMTQFNRRFARIEKAREQTVEQIYRAEDSDMAI